VVIVDRTGKREGERKGKTELNQVASIHLGTSIRDISGVRLILVGNEVKEWVHDGHLLLDD